MKFSYMALLVIAAASSTSHSLIAHSLSVMLSMDGSTILDETFDIPTDMNTFGVGTTDGYSLTFEIDESKLHEDQVTIKTSIMKNEDGTQVLLAKPVLVTQWNHAAFITTSKSDSLIESSLSLKVLPQKFDSKKSVLRRMLDKMGKLLS